MATTMRDIAVPSPVPAYTISSGSGMDENQNSRIAVKVNREQHVPDFNGKHSPIQEQNPDSTEDTWRSIKPKTVESYNQQGTKDGDCSNHIQDCTISNNVDISPNSESTKTDESDESATKSLRSARRFSRREDSTNLSTSTETDQTPRRKYRSVNNNESTEEEPQCTLCGRDFSSWSVLHVHIKTAHPEQDIACDLCHISFDSPRDLNTHRTKVHTSDSKKLDLRKKLQFDTPRSRLDRKNLKNIPKVIGFQDINFIDFSSEKFPLVAKDVCEKSLHLSKGEFCFECSLCGRGFPCSSALEIHIQTCEKIQKKEEVVKKNKRKSTPKFRPQAVTSESDESHEEIDVSLSEKQRNDFFSSLDLRNNEVSPKSSSIKSSEDETDQKFERCYTERRESKPDLADIQSMISVTNIPVLSVKNLNVLAAKQGMDGKPNLNISINNCQSSPSSLSNVSLTSPNFSVLNLISPNYTNNNDHTEEEAQDCFAAECRRMKLRGEFPCKLCSQIFPNLRALKGHNRVHVSVSSGTPSSPYRCNICSYYSLDKATLVRHMRSHNGDRPYECGMCNYAFTTKANCERHLRNRHSKMTRDDVKSSIIYHPSEDPINDSDYLKTSEMNKRNMEKSKETKHEFTLPVNLKINLAALKDKQKSEDLFQAEHQELLKNMSNGADDQLKSEAGTMTEEIEDCPRSSSPMEDQWSGEEALDLRVIKPKYDTPPSDCSDEPEDLTKKTFIKEYNNNEEENLKEPDSVAFPSPPIESKTSDISSLAKMYSSMYPSLSMTQVHQLLLTQLNFPGFFQRLPFPSFIMPQSVFHNANYNKNYLSKDGLGLQMSGGSIMDDKVNANMSDKLQYFQQEALAKIMLKREKDRLANDFYKKSQDEVEKPRLTNEYFTESDKKAFQEILINREAEKKAAYVSPNTSEQTNENKSTSVKMVIKNGVLMPKQKQRRYRTERPFSCEHCSARFTLRSNMERHIKQQHPRFWTQKSRYNVGSGRKPESTKISSDYFKHFETSSQASIHSRGDVSSTGDIHWEHSKSPSKSFQMDDKSDESDNEEMKEVSDEEDTNHGLIIDEGTGNDHLRLLANVTEYLKAKQSNSLHESHETTKDSQPQDLASVSKMLDNVTQTQAFQKYFQDGVRKEDDEYKREDGYRSEEEEGLVAGSTSSDENRSESEVTTKSAKKKSAYSLAPNRVSCPYCFRKFPWSSSLRRHVLTHTGQKPFKCTHCPLLFTTKSNCDRHLLRKHGREALIASSGQTENHEGLGSGSGVTSGSAQSNLQHPNYSLRNVPERPYKCVHCPSSTFSSLSNLTKHMSSKHPNDPILSPEPVVENPDHTRVKNFNPHAPPNVTISPTFPINIPKALSIIPQYSVDGTKNKRFPLTVPSLKVPEWVAGSSLSDREEETRLFRKRSSSDETEACDRKRTSPDLLKVCPLQDSHSDTEIVRAPELPPIPASDLPFKCHLCEGSFGERSEALDHIRLQHPNEFQLLMSKGALETTSEEDRLPHDDHDEVDHSRGRFPDYAHRKVMCAFCMRRFWSAEDLRRHMRTHTGERPFSCDVCHRKFTLKHSMLRHRKKHNANDEVLVGSDEEHATSVISSSRRSVDSEEVITHKTILHQTLTRKEEDHVRSESHNKTPAFKESN